MVSYKYFRAQFIHTQLNLAFARILRSPRHAFLDYTSREQLIRFWLILTYSPRLNGNRFLFIVTASTEQRSRRWNILFPWEIPQIWPSDLHWNVHGLIIHPILSCDVPNRHWIDGKYDLHDRWVSFLYRKISLRARDWSGIDQAEICFYVGFPSSFVTLYLMATRSPNIRAIIVD